jgi:ribose/xylose/arabinose/galactoside ABC-type transport system permease subunit
MILAKYSPLFILGGLCLVLAFASEDFRSARNLQSVAQRTSEIGILATGELVVILTAGIDLSIGSVAALSGVTGCITMKSLAGAGLPDALAVIIGILLGTGTGLLCGLINGIGVTKGKIQPFIMTLGMMMAARGVALILSKGEPVYGLPKEFSWLGGAQAWWVPVVITVSLVLLFAVMLNLTRFGRAIYAIGGNLQAARLSGLSVDYVRAGAYTLSGTMAGIAGVMLASRTSVAAPMGAEMYELDAIAACVIGGASLMGGEGAAVMALAGAFIMIVLRNYCNLENIDVYWQRVLVGCLIIALVFYDNFRKRRAGLLSN